MDRYILDTNVLLDDADAIDLYDIVVMPTSILEELDGLKKSLDEGYNARQAIRKIINAKNIEFEALDIYDGMPLGWDKEKRDNKIIMCAKRNNCTLVSNDVAVRIKAGALGVVAQKYTKQDVEDYKGYIEVDDAYEQSLFYQCMTNRWDLNVNEYLLFKDEDGNIVDKFKYNGKTFEKVLFKSLKSPSFGEVKPLDAYQEIAIDSLINDTFTILTGHAGTAKSLLALAYSMQMLQGNKADKLIIVSNPISAKGAKELGFYQGNRIEKLLQNSIGSMLNSKFNDPNAVKTLMGLGMLDIVPLGDVRGMEIRKREILYITEGQNLSVDLAKLAIQRVADGAKIIIEGDTDSQVDNKLFEGKNSGIKRAIEIFKGSELFSYVHLPNIYRSKIAEIADGM